MDEKSFLASQVVTERNVQDSSNMHLPVEMLQARIVKLSLSTPVDSATYDDAPKSDTRYVETPETSISRRKFSLTPGRYVSNPSNHVLFLTDLPAGVGREALATRFAQQEGFADISEFEYKSEPVYYLTFADVDSAEKAMREILVPGSQVDDGPRNYSADVLRKGEGRP